MIYVLNLRHFKWLIMLLLLILILLLFVLSGRWFIRQIYPLKYSDYIFKYSKENQVDPYLTASIILVESKYYPNAVSKKGARGLMQIMPRTGEWVAQQLDLEGFHPDYLFDPEINIKIGTWYLSYLMKQFNGDLTLVLAAYNGGQGNVRDWLQQRNSNKENDLEDFPFRETRQYVIKINRVYKVYKRLYG